MPDALTTLNTRLSRLRGLLVDLDDVGRRYDQTSLSDDDVALALQRMAPHTDALAAILRPLLRDLRDDDWQAIDR